MKPPSALPRRFLQPAGARCGEVVTKDRATLRWASLRPGSTSANCVLVGGFSECLEKYFETLVDLSGLGLAVWFLEWRGQGDSTRPAFHPGRPEARDYDRDARDLADFARGIVREAKPFVVVGHSMGAAIALLAMREEPCLFDAAALSAPMLAINTSHIPRLLAQSLSTLAVGLGLGHAVVPGTRMWPVDPAAGPERSKTSGDAVRCGVQPTWFTERPELRVDGITFAWIGAALDLCRRFEDARLLSGINAPVLIGSAGIDHFVDPAAHRRAASIMPNCRVANYPDAKHELFMEADGIRNAWIAEIDGFLRQVGADRRPASASSTEASISLRGRSDPPLVRPQKAR